MKRRSFMKKSAVLAGSALAANTINAKPANSLSKNLYELKVYRLPGRSSKNLLKNYYNNAVIPFLNNRGAKVGAFDEYSMEEPPMVYIIHVHESPEDYWNTIHEMKTDRTFLDAAEEYFSLPPNQPVFERYETFLLEAFNSIPDMRMPAENRNLFELRTYESYNEDALRRKVKMFNKEELPLFEKVGLHPVFFGEILAGRYMPALIYMLWFKDMEERETNWNKFRNSEEWGKMSGKKEYANTVSKVNKKFLVPADYSQI